MTLSDWAATTGIPDEWSISEQFARAIEIHREEYRPPTDAYQQGLVDGHTHAASIVRKSVRTVTERMVEEAMHAAWPDYSPDPNRWVAQRDWMRMVLTAVNDLAGMTTLESAWVEGAKAAGGYGHEDGWTPDFNPFSENPYRARAEEVSK